MFGLVPEPSRPLDGSEVEEVVRRLQAAGYRCGDLDPARVARFLKLRADYSDRLGSLSRHLGAEKIEILPTAR
jgi:hypothetical protein